LPMSVSKMIGIGAIALATARVLAPWAACGSSVRAARRRAASQKSARGGNVVDNNNAIARG
jgi:hypothetical protein